MTNECKQQFTLRISQANKTEMIVILYEMLLTYTQDAKNALKEGKIQEFRDFNKKGRACLEELIASLNLEYEVAVRMLSLYLYCNRELSKADIRKDAEPVEHVEMVIGKLHKAYEELAKQDESGPVMQNSQTVYTGLTYGRNCLSENLADQGVDSGFRA